jgi:hypothetical protein
MSRSVARWVDRPAACPIRSQCWWTTCVGIRLNRDAAIAGHFAKGERHFKVTTSGSERMRQSSRSLRRAPCPQARQDINTVASRLPRVAAAHTRSATGRGELQAFAIQIMLSCKSIRPGKMKLSVSITDAGCFAPETGTTRDSSQLRQASPLVNWPASVRVQSRTLAGHARLDLRRNRTWNRHRAGRIVLYQTAHNSLV